MLNQLTARRIVLPCFFLVAGISVPCAAGSVTNLVATHDEFGPYGAFDTLKWSGDAQFFIISRHLEGEDTGWNESNFPGGNGTFEYHTPAGPKGTITSYFVRAVDRNSSPTIVWSHGVACGELMLDPAFEAGPLTYSAGGFWSNAYWAQFTDNPGGSTGSFVQGPDGTWYYALLGGHVGSDGLISSGVAVRRVPGLDSTIAASIGATGLLSASALFRAEVLSSTSEPRTVANDRLSVFLLDSEDDQNFLAGTVLLDNTVSVDHVNWSPPYDALIGKSLEIVFRADNNVTLPTTFTLAIFDLSVSLVYNN